MRGPRSHFWNFLWWTLLIGPLLVIAYIVIFYLPPNTWPIGSNTPENESLFSYYAPVLPTIWLAGAVLGSGLYMAKEMIR